jgi:hypothetical protein
MRFRKWFALPRTKHDADTQGEIILRNARVEKFTAILRTSHRKRLYPNPIDLSFAEVKWWAFDPHSPKAGDDYKRLLAGDRDLQRHTFRSVEQNLINQGYEEAADEVHKDMRKWLRRHANLWNRFWWGIWDGLTDSTTSPKRLLIIVISWFFLSILLFRSPANIVPSAEGLSIHKNWKAGDHPADSLWGLKDGVWMALRYHVPVAAFTAKHEWQPAKDGRLIVPWPVPRPPSWLNAEDYANIVLAVHWIVLPIILLLTSRKLFRRVDK